MSGLMDIMRDWKRSKETNASKGALEALKKVHEQNLADMAKANAVGAMLDDLETQAAQAQDTFNQERTSEALKALHEARSRLSERGQIAQAKREALTETYESCYRRTCAAMRDHLPAMINSMEKAIVEREGMEQAETRSGMPYRESGGLMLLKKGVRNLTSRLDHVRDHEVLADPSMMQWSSMNQWLQKTIGIDPRREVNA